MSTVTAPPQGLTSEEVSQRIAAGKSNVAPAGPNRSTKEILKANLFTRFNMLIAILLVVIVLVAPIQDALFGLVMVINAVIGIIQELRAKRTLDRLRLIDAPQAHVIRDGQKHRSGGRSDRRRRPHRAPQWRSDRGRRQHPFK